MNTKSLPDLVEFILEELGFTWSDNHSAYINNNIQIIDTGYLNLSVIDHGEFQMKIIPTKFNLKQVKAAISGFMLVGAI